MQKHKKIFDVNFDTKDDANVDANDPDLNRNATNCRDAAEITLHFINVKY